MRLCSSASAGEQASFACAPADARCDLELRYTCSAHVQCLRSNADVQNVRTAFSALPEGRTLLNAHQSKTIEW
jgi:hypothetical protein